MQYHKFYKDFSLSALVAGFITVLVGFTSSVVIVIQAAQHLGATPVEISSWIWALGLGIGIPCIVLSLYYKIPVVIAWSTPGAALLMTAPIDMNLHQAIGAFIFSGILMIVAGFTGLFERLVQYIPVSLASAMLAGVLLQFGLSVFEILPANMILICSLLLVYQLAKRFCARYAILLVLLSGIAITWWQGQLHFSAVTLEMTYPIWIKPEWSITALIGVGLPLFIVTMTSQNLPGIAIMNASGYRAPTSSVVGWTGVSTSILAPFGAFAINFAAISAAICLSDEAHPDKKRRYMAAVSAGVFYILIGLFGATITSLFFAFPKVLVTTIAGLALFSTISSGLFHAMLDSKQREPALITFLLTASGMSLFGLGSAFWGLIVGVIANFILNHRKTV